MVINYAVGSFFYSYTYIENVQTKPINQVEFYKKYCANVP